MTRRDDANADAPTDAVQTESAGVRADRAEMPVHVALAKGLAIGILCTAILLGGRWLGRNLQAMTERVPEAKAGAEEGGLYVGDSGGPQSAVPAPPGGKRLFAQSGVAQPGVKMFRYHTGIALPEVVSYYLSEMPQRGWRRLKRESEQYSSEYEGEILAFQNGGRHCLIAVSEGRVDPGTMVTVVLK